MSSFWSDLSDFGSGMLDDVGEGFGNLVNGWTTDDQTTNAGTTQQPETPVKDNHGNAVTGSQPISQSMKNGSTLAVRR
ncbi:hypothetical protein [Vibrio mediterranei]|uniref:hypothetical protein n=1 Tax=Vibrio mediterranei TaxID=689 RepID=UPI0035A0E3BD